MLLENLPSSAPQPHRAITPRGHQHAPTKLDVLHGVIMAFEVADEGLRLEVKYFHTPVPASYGECAAGEIEVGPIRRVRSRVDLQELAHHTDVPQFAQPVRVAGHFLRVFSQPVRVAGHFNCEKYEIVYIHSYATYTARGSLHRGIVTSTLG